MPKLVFTDTKFAGREYEFAREKTAIGRADDNLLVIRDPSVSSHHCEILVNGAEVIVRDLGSRNGTFVNGARLMNQQSQVKAGGTVRFGTVEARVEIDHAEARDDATEITAVYSHGRAIRDQRRARQNSPAANPAMRLEPSDDGESGEQTILMPHAPGPASLPEATVPMSRAEPAPAAAPKRGLWIGVVLSALFLAVVAWWIWFRK